MRISNNVYKLVLAVAVLLVLAAPVLAQPVQQQVAVQITSPEMGAEVRGLVPIIGSAAVEPFQFYKIEYGIGSSPNQWALIGSLRETPVINGQLEVWDTNTVPDGVYTLRLQAVKTDGNFEEFIVRGVVVANTRPTSTPTPEVTETPLPEEGPQSPQTAATATPGLPTATPTTRVIAPQDPIGGATPTPTLSVPNESVLPIDPEGWDQAFLLGAASMGAVFVLLGLLFAIRSLL